MQQKRKLSLPAVLLKELEAQGSTRHGGSSSRAQVSRKEQRKAQRVTKRQARTSHNTTLNKTPAGHSTAKRSASRPTPRPIPIPTPKLRSTSGRTRVIDSEDDELVDQDEESTSGGEDDDGIDLDEEYSEDDGFDMEDSESQTGSDTQGHNTTTSKSDLKKLAQDDAEIADLERKLGVKGGKSAPKDFDEDGLGDLLEGLEGGSGDDDAESSEKRKRKAEADEWLAQKRRKAQVAAAKLSRQSVQQPNGLGGSDEDEDEYEGAEDEGFSGFSDDQDSGEEEDRPRQRENPYVAPTTNVAKYVPPSLRQKSSAVEGDSQLHKRLQGLVNRLTNDSLIGITNDVSSLYTTNPRQAVTTNLTDIILALVCSPEKRPDAFFTMIAGFIAATHKTLGMAFAAQFVQQLVETLDKYHAQAAGNHSDPGSNHAATLLSELYNMQVISGNLVFDYIRLFLQNLNELNTELLLRIIQLCGPALRREDPQSLQQIVSRVGSANAKGISVRTSFMIEEMQKLQSNKTKANARNKDIADQRAQIRKRIGTLRGVQDSQPLRIGLQDIHNADKAGKWWLVGASWAGKSHGLRKVDDDGNGDDDDDVVDVTMDFANDDDFDIPDLWQLAREQGFNTEVRQRIFVALHAATDYENGELLLKKLRLNKHQRKEIPEVIVRSGERQMEYNPYYALIAGRFCVDREVRFQFRRSLMTRYGKMGEDIDMGDEDEADMDEAEYSTRWLYNTAKLYGSLVVNRCLGLVDIIKHRNLMALQEKSQMFVELVFITLLQDLSQNRLKEVLGSLDEDLVRGVQYFVKKHVRGTDLVRDKKDARKLKKSCDEALEILDGMQAIDTV